VNVLIFMIPAALAMAAAGLAALIWSLRSGQFDDPTGAAARVLIDKDRPD
jgi:cbb3-type cytochrome oxidase maturation protein